MPIKRIILWTVSLAVLAGSLTAAYYFDARYRQEREDKAKQESDERFNKLAVRQAKAGIIKMDSDDADFTFEKAVSRSWLPQVPVYGRVVPHPRATAEVRTVFAGKLRKADAVPWPSLAQSVKAGDVLGWVDVRVGPQDRLDLLVKRVEAGIRQQGAETIHKFRAERLKRLEEAGSQNEKDAARVELAEASTQFEIARAAGKLYEDALNALDHPAGKGSEPKPAWSEPIVAPAGGEIIELLAQPGMTVEAGSVIVRTADFSKVLVRLDVPAASLKEPPPATLELVLLPSAPAVLEGANNRVDDVDAPLSVQGKLIGSAGQVDAGSQTAAYFYEIANPPAFCRPGLFVKAMLPASEGQALDAVSVPRTALLFHQGRAMVYVNIGSTSSKFFRFRRQEVQVLAQTGDRVILRTSRDFGPDDLVVVSGTQAILSAEFLRDADD